MREKLQVSLLMILIAIVGAAAALGISSTSNPRNTKVLGTLITCKNAGAVCLNNNECCSGNCVMLPFLKYLRRGQCAAAKPTPTPYVSKPTPISRPTPASTKCITCEEWKKYYQLNIQRLIDEMNKACLSTPTPTPTTIVKCGLNTFSVAKQCAGAPNRFSYMKYQCYDGFAGSEGSESSCKTSDDWKSYAEQICKSRCNPPTRQPLSPTITPSPTSFLVSCQSKGGFCIDTAGITDCGSGFIAYDGPALGCKLTCCLPSRVLSPTKSPTTIPPQ